MVFADREAELEALRRLERRSGGKLLVVFGRRRVGKTSLLVHYQQQSRHRSLYIYVDLLKREDLLTQISRDVSAQLGMPASFRTWDELWKYIGDIAGKGLLVVVDEFQRLRTVSPEALTMLQRAWDEKLRHLPLFLVLMGSSVGMVRRLAVDSRGALFGRATGILHVRPFTYAQARALIPGPEVRRIELYAAFGGTPHYLSLALATPGDLWRKLRGLVFESISPLREEPLNVLAAELRDPEKYYSILRAIASGKRALGEIADASGVSQNRLMYYLGTLESLFGVVRRDDPVLGGRKSRRYALDDPFFRFWFRFVHRNVPMLEMGELRAVMETVRQEFAAHVGTVFESIVRELVGIYSGRSLGGLRIEPERIGAWWDRRGHEVDLCAPMRDGSVLLGDVTWSSKGITVGHLENLRLKAKLISPRSEKRFLLAGRRVDEEVREAMGKDGIVLDLDDLTKAFDKAGRV